MVHKTFQFILEIELEGELRALCVYLSRNHSITEYDFMFGYYHLYKGRTFPHMECYEIFTLK